MGIFKQLKINQTFHYIKIIEGEIYNQFGISSLKKTISDALRNPWSPVVLC